VLEAPWKKIVCTPVDISVKTRITGDMIAEIKKSNSAAAQYVVKFFMATRAVPICGMNWRPPRGLTRR